VNLREIKLAEDLATLLEDSLFYARMYRDTCENGRRLREKMIDDAVELLQKFKTGEY
jgi:hypothetical protein